MGLPYGQVKDAASVAASTENGASPSKTKLWTWRLDTGEANEMAEKLKIIRERKSMFAILVRWMAASGK